MRSALKQEGLTDDQITIEKDFVISDENGFISWKLEHGYPYITHFLIYTDKRRSTAFLSLFLKFKREVVAQGHRAFIAEVIPGKEFFERFLLKLGCRTPYAKAEGRKYYFVHLK